MLDSAAFQTSPNAAWAISVGKIVVDILNLGFFRFSADGAGSAVCYCLSRFRVRQKLRCRCLAPSSKIGAIHAIWAGHAQQRSRALIAKLRRGKLWWLDALLAVSPKLCTSNPSPFLPYFKLESVDSARYSRQINVNKIYLFVLN